jgi:hypothetical protein
MPPLYPPHVRFPNNKKLTRALDARWGAILMLC